MADGGVQVSDGVLVVVNTAWPRKAVYNPAPPFHWALQWGGVLFVGAALLLGLIRYRLVQRHKVGILPQHAAVSAPELAESESR